MHANKEMGDQRHDRMMQKTRHLLRHSEIGRKKRKNICTWEDGIKIFQKKFGSG